ncbi:hypothetical protein JCM8547_001318, partial [Rhodosporidiobolus lusitaniae]
MGKADEAAVFFLPSYEDATRPAQQVIEYHVYRRGGIFSLDDVVTGPDKTQILYTLDFPLKWSGKWDLTLTRGNKTGPLVAKIAKSMWKSSFTVTLADGTEVKCKHAAMLQLKYDFTGTDGREYRWLPDSAWSMKAYDYSLYLASDLDANRSRDACKVLAHWRTPAWSWS